MRVGFIKCQDSFRVLKHSPSAWPSGHKRQTGKRGVAGSIHDGDIFSFWHFCLLPVPHNSVNPIQMKSKHDIHPE